MFNIYQENYILPYYYTASPYYSIYHQMPANNTKIMKQEFKGQLSIYAPIYEWKKITLNASFTLKTFWQLYSNRPWFRSTDYNPEIFFSFQANKDLSSSIGIAHESNGKGDEFERSWNRVYGKINYHISDFSLEVMGWYLPINNEAIESENKKIEDYLGHEKISLSYKIGNFDSKISFQNIERIDRIQFTASESLEITRDYALYFQYFYGYGQSLIEYDHFTQGVGIGLKFLDNNVKNECPCNN